mgnify:CR=1 FL=1
MSQSQSQDTVSANQSQHETCDLLAGVSPRQVSAAAGYKRGKVATKENSFMQALPSPPLPHKRIDITVGILGKTVFACRLRFCFNCVINKYLRGFERKLDISDWQSRAAGFNSITRKVETDWKMVSGRTIFVANHYKHSNRGN